MALTMIKTATLALLMGAPLALTVGALTVRAAPFPMAIGPETLDIAQDTALTETYCDLRGTVQSSLARDFAETPRLAALTGTGMTMELWTSDQSGSWTVVHHGTDGITCIVSTGMDWAADRDAVLVLETVLGAEVFQS